MSRPSTIFIARHGEREDYVDRQWYTKPQRAYDDPPLAVIGRQQAAELGQRLKSERIDMIVSSPFQRCVETAHIVSSQRQVPLPINIEPGICEVLWDYPAGYYDMANIKRLFNLVNTSHVPLMRETELEWEPSSKSCRPRVQKWLTRMLWAGYPNKGRILIVAHGAPISHMVHLLKRDHRQSPLKVNTCGLTRFDVEPDGVLLKFPPGFETAEELKKRFPLVDTNYSPTGVTLSKEPKAWERLMTKLDSVKTVLAVGHGASVGASLEVLTGHWQYVGLTTLSKCTILDQASSSLCVYDQEYFNDSTHLSDQKYDLRAH